MSLLLRLVWRYHGFPTSLHQGLCTCNTSGCPPSRKCWKKGPKEQDLKRCLRKVRSRWKKETSQIKNSNCMLSVIAIANSGAQHPGRETRQWFCLEEDSVSGTHKEAQGGLLEARQELLPSSSFTFITTSPPQPPLWTNIQTLAITGAQRMDASLLLQDLWWPNMSLGE